MALDLYEGETEEAKVSHCGAYVVRLHIDGAWVPILIDEKVPCNFAGPKFAKSATGTEIWIPLLEKAYAKLHGSYEAIEGGHASDGLADLTGGHASSLSLTVRCLHTLFACNTHAIRCSAPSSTFPCSAAPPLIISSTTPPLIILYYASLDASCRVTRRRNKSPMVPFGNSY
jgi:hypothetical protein